MIITDTPGRLCRTRTATERDRRRQPEPATAHQGASRPILVFLAAVVAMAGCAGRVDGSRQCDHLVDSGWEALGQARARGFDGTISYATATGLLTAAKAQQVIERFPSCINKARRAHHYIAEARAGR